MTQENLKKYNAKINEINNIPRDNLRKLIENGQCPYPSEFLLDVPMGMFHCPLCLDMIVAGLKHA